jgi:hypothetical protein
MIVQNDLTRSAMLRQPRNSGFKYSPDGCFLRAVSKKSSGFLMIQLPVEPPKQTPNIQYAERSHALAELRNLARCYHVVLGVSSSCRAAALRRSPVAGKPRPFFPLRGAGGCGESTNNSRCCLIMADTRRASVRATTPSPITTRRRRDGGQGNRVSLLFFSSFFSVRISFAALTPVGFGSRRLRLRDRVGDSACLF